MHRLRFGLIILAAASVLGGCRPAGNNGVEPPAREQVAASQKSITPASDFLTALAECHTLYEATAGVEHPLLEKKYRQSGGNGTVLMEFLGEMMGKNYRSVAEKSNAALERADASLAKLSSSALIPDSLKQDYATYKALLTNNNAFFSDPYPMKFLARWFNDYGDEKVLYEKICAALPLHGKS